MCPTPGSAQSVDRLPGRRIEYRTTPEARKHHYSREALLARKLQQSGNIVMTAQDAISHEIVTFDDLKELATTSGPCITMAVPLPNPAEIDVRLKNAIRGVQETLAERKADA